MHKSSNYGNAFSWGSRSAEWEQAVLSPGPRSPVFDPLYDSEGDEESGIDTLSALGRLQHQGRQRRTSSFGSLNITTASSGTSPSEMGGASLRSRGKVPHGTISSDSAIQQSHPASRISDQVDSKASESRETSIPFTQQAAFRLFVFSFSAAWLGAFFLYFFAFASYSMELRPNEQHLFTANSLFASSIKLRPLQKTSGFDEESDDFETKAFLFVMHMPRHGAASHSKLGQRDLRIPATETKIWTFWLSRGSRVDVDFDVPRSGIKFAIIKGSKDLSGWKKNHGGSMLRGRSGTTFVCQEGALYSFAFYNPITTEVDASISLSIISYKLDTSNAAAECELSFMTGRPCEIMLPFGVPVFLIVGTSDSKEAQPASAERGSFLQSAHIVEISYGAKVISYLVLLAWPFGVSFLAFLLSIMNQGKNQNAPHILLAANALSSQPRSHSSEEDLSEGSSLSSGHFQASIAGRSAQQAQNLVTEKVPLLGSSPHKAK